MLNNEISPFDGQYKSKFNKIYSVKFYDKFTKCNINKKVAFENNDYNRIVPNLKMLINDNKFKQKVINGYVKLYYNNIIIKKVIEYDAFYPETFYYVWEIINKFNIIDDQMNKYLVIDDGVVINNKQKKINVSQGHLEALIKYCEDNFKYEKNEYIRIPLNKSFLNEQDKKFISVYNNHKTYDFMDYNDNTYNKVYEYFKDKNKKFNFVIATSTKLVRNMISLVTLKQNGNAIFYIDDFIDQTNDQIINILSTLFKKISLYQPIIQDKLDTSCWLILENYTNDNDILNIIKPMIFKQNVTNITVINTNISKVRDWYISNYIDKLLTLYSKTKLKNDIYNQHQNVIFFHSPHFLDVKWGKKYKLMTKDMYDINNIQILNYDYVAYRIEYDQSESYNSTEYYCEKLHSIKRKLNEYKRLINTKEQCVYNNYDEDIIDWNKLENCINLHKNLKKIITWKCNAESINNTWLQFYEIITHENLIDHNINKFKSVHLCETTGSFVFALNHYIKTQTNIKTFEWYAHSQSYNNDFIGKYDLYNMFPENWLIDNCDLKKINTINNYINNTHLHNINLITCNNITFQEFITYAQIYAMLNILPKGGIAIIKMFIPFTETIVISLLYLLSGIFSNVKLVKPITSYQDNSEVYCVCNTYHGFNSIEQNIKDKLYQLYINYDVNGSIFDIINPNFMNNLSKISDSLSDKQINSIKRSLYLRDIYYHDYDIQNELSVEKEECNNKWINENNIKKIKELDKIIYYQFVAQ